MAVYLQELKKQYVGPDGSVVPVIVTSTLSPWLMESRWPSIGTSGSGKTTFAAAR